MIECNLIEFYYRRNPEPGNVISGRNLCTATCPYRQSYQVQKDMNPCEQILAGMKSVIRACHADRRLPEDAQPQPAESEDLYLFLIPVFIALLAASRVITFFVWAGRKEGTSSTSARM